MNCYYCTCTEVKTETNEFGSVQTVCPTCHARGPKAQDAETAKRNYLIPHRRINRLLALLNWPLEKE